MCIYFFPICCGDVISLSYSESYMCPSLQLNPIVHVYQGIFLTVSTSGQRSDIFMDFIIKQSICRQIKSIFNKNRAFSETSMKFGM